MSELICEVVQIQGWAKHPNADTLAVTQVYSFPAIFKLGELDTGDLAVYFPVDALLPVRPEFAFVWKDKLSPTERERAIRAVRLRGIFSMGLLMPAHKFPEVQGLPPGTNVADILGVKKYEPPEPACLRGENIKTPSWFAHYTDIQSLRKYNGLFVVGEEVVVTEKVHGANGRYCYKDGQLWVGSHANTKKPGGDDVWNQVAIELDLATKLQRCPNLIFFGEVYGQVQGGYDYGIKHDHSSFIVFDIYDTDYLKFLDYDEACGRASDAGLGTVPLLYRGPWNGFTGELEALADGDSIVAQNNQRQYHIREGFVIKPIHERWDPKIQRVILKLHGQDFLVGRKKKKE